MFEGFPGAFHEEALLRIHDGRLARADAEKSGVEGIELRQRRARPHVIRVLEQRLADPDRFQVLGGELANRLDAVDQVFPELRGVIRAGKARGETDDRNVLNGSLVRPAAHEGPLAGGFLRGRA